MGEVTIHRVPYSNADAWHTFRERGIGGSECSIVMGVNPYQSLARLFHLKIGNLPRDNFYNQKTFMGQQLEDFIGKMWSYWDGESETSYIENYNAGKVIRKARKVNGFAVNSDYPWLYGSVDKLMNIEGGFNLITKEAFTKPCILECKNISSQAASLWEAGIPRYFIIQIMVYCIIFETSYAEIAMLKNGNELQVIPVEKDEELCQQIIETTKNFWEKRVLKGREALQYKREGIMSGNMALAEEAEGVIQRLEPESDGTDDYMEFMAEKFRVEKERIAGTPQWYSLCKQDETFKKYIGGLTAKRQLVQNQLRNIFVTEQVEKIDFKNLGNATWSKNSNGTLVLRTSLKEKPTESFVETELSKLKTEY